MALEEYVRKRSFEHTPEPKPSTKSSKQTATAPYFCVQRHDATRLHYDFRLEIDGVLKSWAVPKGPTLDPTLKRLAAHVEDHPVEYGSFEGNIPEGNYGAGSVMLWDRGTFELLGDKPGAAQIEKGDLKFRLHGEKLGGEFALVHMKGRGKGNDWLLIKKRDAAAVPGWEVEDHATSVLSGRTQEEIAQNLPAHKEKRQAAGATDRTWESSRPARARRAAPARTAEAPPKKTPKKKVAVDLSALQGAKPSSVPSAIVPMHATLADKPPRGEDWLFEVKWDGVRAIAFVDRERVQLLSRSGNSCEKQYPELSVIHHYLAAEQAVLDTEIAVLDEKGISRFELIQPRIHVNDPNAIAHLARSRPVTMFAFDLLYLDGYDLRQVNLIERKRLLEQIVTPSPELRISEAFPDAGEQLLAAAQENGLEGIVAKHARSCYEPRRSREWLKLKVVQQQEFLICGFTAGERDHFGALVLGVFDREGKLVWAGNVGTGFDQKKMAEIARRMQPLVTDKQPFAVRPKIPGEVSWVRPELVCMVKFSNWTEEGRLRAPVFLGFRTDIDPKDVRRENGERDREQAPAPRGGSLRERSPIAAGNQAEMTVEVDGRSLKFTNLNKIFYPRDGYTKRDVINYYDSVAEMILPHLKDRPLSLKRYPNGIDDDFFFQKDVKENFASWLRTENIYHSETSEKPTRYVFAEDRASLLYLANLACIDHNPWMSRHATLGHPDFLLIDLDPQECAYDKIVEAALLVRQKLDALGLQGYPKTTGGDGMHIYVPLEPVYSYEEVRQFAKVLQMLVMHERPELFTTPRAVSKRTRDKVYFDSDQISKSKTIAAPYVLRAYDRAPVATPLAWQELTPGLNPQQFHIRNARERFERVGDLFEGVLTRPQRLEGSLENLDAMVRGARNSA